MKFVTGIVLALFSTVALTGCASTQPPAYGSAVHQAPSDAPPYRYYDKIHNRDTCNSQQFPSCGGSQ